MTTYRITDQRPTGLHIPIDCPVCHRTGRVDGDACDDCDGLGRTATPATYCGDCGGLYPDVYGARCTLCAVELCSEACAQAHEDAEHDVRRCDGCDQRELVTRTRLVTPAGRHLQGDYCAACHDLALSGWADDSPPFDPTYDPTPY